MVAALARAGFAPVAVPYLLDMADFVRISGEDFRRRLFVTTDPAGGEYCLRPEFTIPVCRLAARTGGRFCYSGTIFRKGRPDEGDEVVQAGAEIIGAHEAAATDAELLALALRLVAEGGLARPNLLVGDVGLFAALLQSLNVPPAWSRRLMHQFGDTAKVLATLDEMTRPRDGAVAAFGGHADIVAALSAFQGEAVGDLFAEILAIAGIETVGGRSTDEIAERVLEQASLATGHVVAPAEAVTIRVFLTLETPLAAADDALGAIADRLPAPAPFAAARRLFAARVAALEAAGTDLARAVFAAGFGRKLGYYDGFVFDLADPSRPEIGQVAGGGRYDGVVRSFGAPEGFRAAGFALWPQRLAGGRA